MNREESGRAARRAPKSDRDYEVGYGRPPRASQWKAGESGNPSGRKKRKASPSVKAAILAALSSSIDVVQGGKAKKVSTADAIALRLQHDLLNGTGKDRIEILKMLHTFGVFENAEVDDLDTEYTPLFTEEDRRYIAILRDEIGDQDEDEAPNF